MRRREMILPSGGGGDDVSGYVKDGLIIFWDGIYNTASGHDASSTLWEDLSGNGHHATYNSANLIGDSYLQTNSRGLSYVALSSAEIESYVQGMTEIVIDPANVSGDKAILTLAGNRGGNGSLYIYQGNICFNYYSPLKSLGFTTGKHYYNSQLWVDGEQQVSTNKKQSWGTKSNYLGSYTSASSYPFNGKIYALRAYDRILSDAEIRQNWLEDKRRFGIGG